MIKATSLGYSKNNFNFNSRPNYDKQSSLSFANSICELAAKAVGNTKDRSVSFKHAFNLIQMNKKFMRPVYGIGCKVMDYWKVCDELFENSGILSEHPNVDKNLLRVVVSEFLWGHKKIQGKGEVFDIVRGKKEILTNLLKEHSEEVKDKLNVFYVRVNLLKTSVEEVLAQLDEMGYIFIETPSKYKKYLKKVEQLEHDSFMADFHYKELFVFNIKAKPFLVDHSLVNDKLIIIQSKSSLIPVHLMGIKPGDIVLDMCAAPGMKTSLIAAQLKGSGKVWAVDKDRNRFKTMMKNLDQFGAQKFIHLENCDVLNLRSPEDFDLILLDAPCSGSGIAGRLGETNNSPERLRKLQWIQMKLLMNALTKYPSVRRIVYSTCSIYAEENEAVVDEVMERLKENTSYELINSHTLVSGFSKGLDTYKCGSFCIRLSAEQDFVNGFFVAVFDRKTLSETEGMEEVRREEVDKDDEFSKVEIPQTHTSLKKKKRKNNAEGKIESKKSKQEKNLIMEEYGVDSKVEIESSEVELVQSQKSLKKKKKKTKAKTKQEKTPIEMMEGDSNEENGSSEVKIPHPQTKFKKNKRKNTAQDITPAKKSKQEKTMPEIMDEDDAESNEEEIAEVESPQSKTKTKRRKKKNP